MKKLVVIGTMLLLLLGFSGRNMTGKTCHGIQAGSGCKGQPPQQN